MRKSEENLGKPEENIGKQQENLRKRFGFRVFAAFNE